MGFKVVNVFNVPGEDFGDELGFPLGATLINGVWMQEEEIVAQCRDADALIGVVSVQPFNRRLMGALPKCRVIAGIGIGYDKTDLEAATEQGIAVTNVPDYCLDEVSGLAIGMILSLGHKLLQIDRAVRERRVVFTVDKKALDEIARPMFRMREQTVGIVGFGKIGTVTAMKARGLGMRVIAHDPYVLGPVMESRGVTPVDFDTLLKKSDFISIHTPLNVETKNMFGYEQFGKMKPTAYFINTARGGCMDQPALIRALQKNLIAGAGIDVTTDEPIAQDNPLLGMGNVILTGHSAWYSLTSEADLYRRPMTQVVQALRGEFPVYTVNTEVKNKWMARWGVKD
ncbi:MAG: C-terminal binding protein [Syntrophales bacterium]|jgi:D-3-phosphoglycerate dehydrogenase|nr:C-terminal binding protein [Syntrophales bacterium]